MAVAYQPDGLVRLLGSGRPDAPVSVEITRTYKQAFVLGAGVRTVTFTGAAIAAGDTVSVLVNGTPAAFTRNGSQLTLTGATDGALVIVTVVKVERQDFTLPSADGADDDVVHAQTSTLPLIIFGGQGDDVIDGGSGGDVIFGDRGRVLYFDPARPLPDFGDPVPDMARLAAWEAAATSVFGHGGSGDRTDGIARGIALAISADCGIGGKDTITTLGGHDVVVGGAGGDVLTTGAGDDIVLGDSGRIAAGDRAKFGLELAPLPLIAGLVTTIAPRAGGDDRIWTGSGNDVALGGNGADRLVLGEGDDIALGDHGALRYSDTLAAGARLWQIYTSDFLDGGLDRLEGEGGDDLLIGGTGGDAIDGDTGDDLLFGDQVSLQRQLEGALSLRFQNAPSDALYALDGAQAPLLDGIAGSVSRSRRARPRLGGLRGARPAPLGRVRGRRGGRRRGHRPRRRLHHGRRGRRHALRPARQRHAGRRRRARGRGRRRRPASDARRSARRPHGLPGRRALERRRRLHRGRRRQRRHLRRPRPGRPDRRQLVAVQPDQRRVAPGRRTTSSSAARDAGSTSTSPPATSSTRVRPTRT